MSRQRDLPESVAWRIIGRLQSWKKQGSVADAVGVQELSFQQCGVDSKKEGMLDVVQYKICHVLPQQILTDISCK